MANEFIIKRGLIVSGSSELSGSLTVTGLTAGSGQILEIGTGGLLQTSGHTLDQNLGTSASPSFAGLTVNGNTTVTGNLDVQGTTTFINTTDIFIKDKLVVIASGSTTPSAADGGGLYISGAAASITWDNGNSRMAFNKPLFVNGALTATSLAGTGGSITGLNASNISSGTIGDAYLPGTISSDITGNAATATTATTANQVSNALTAGTYLTSAGTYNGSAARTFAVDATTTNTASKVVARDASGNFAAGTITAALTGNASTATTLQTARTINGVSFNGSANITITSNTTNALTIGTGLSGTSFNGSSAVTIAIDSTVATLTGTQTLTNKTLTSPTITSPSFGSSNIVSTGASSNLSGSFSGSFIGNGSGLSGVSASFPTTTATVASTLEYFVSDGTSKKVTQTAIGTYMAGAGLTSAGGILALSQNSISGVTLGNYLNTLTRGTYLTGNNYNGSAATTWAVDATTTNTASKVVARDASGNFAAGTITATLTGNASTATTLQTARTINGVSFNGSANITVTANTTNALTIGTGLSGTSFNGSSAVTIAIDSTVATLTGTQTLTNKTLTSPSITTPTINDTVVINTTGITAPTRILKDEATTTVGTVNVLTAGNSAGEGVFFDYVISNGTNMRAGTVMAVSNGSTVRYAEQATTDIGNTSAVTLQCSQSTGDITLQANSTAAGYFVRALVRTV